LHSSFQRNLFAFASFLLLAAAGSFFLAFAPAFLLVFRAAADLFAAGAFAPALFLPFLIFLVFLALVLFFAAAAVTAAGAFALGGRARGRFRLADLQRVAVGLFFNPITDFGGRRFRFRVRGHGDTNQGGADTFDFLDRRLGNADRFRDR